MRESLNPDEPWGKGIGRWRARRVFRFPVAAAPGESHTRRHQRRREEAMSPQQVFLAFLLLVAVWTVIWGTVVLRSGESVAYADLAPRVARLRRRLFYALGFGVLLVFLVSMRG